MPNRKKIRCPHHDYSLSGNYFVTICTKDRHPWFGEVINGEMVLSDIGVQVEKCWHKIPDFFPDAVLDQFVVMPDHVHGIVCINDFVGADHYRPKGGRCSAPTDLMSIVRGFKIGVTKWCHKNQYSDFSWQRSFHDRIIRNNQELERIRHYIFHNPEQYKNPHKNI